MILLTAKNSESDKLRGFRLGVDDYITKPFSFAELSARITAVLNRARGASPTQRNLFTFGNVTVDLDRLSVVREGELYHSRRQNLKCCASWLRIKGGRSRKRNY